MLANYSLQVPTRFNGVLTFIVPVDDQDLSVEARAFFDAVNHGYNNAEELGAAAEKLGAAVEQMRQRKVASYFTDLFAGWQAECVLHAEGWREWRETAVAA